MTKNKNLLKISTLAAVIGLFSVSEGYGFNYSTTSVLQVTATVIGSCNVSTTAGLAFGQYDPLAPNAVTAQSNVIVGCAAPNTPFQVELGTGGSLNSLSRYMSGPDNGTLDYQLYTEAGGAGHPIFGDGNGGTSFVQGATNNATPSSAAIPIHGVILAGQTDLSMGLHTDTVNVLLRF